MYPGEHASRTPDKVAYVMATSGQEVTYRQLDDGANRLSQLLRAHGLRPGDHVALCLENHPRYLEVVWGARYAGLVYTACSTRLTPSELAYIVDDCGARAYITSTAMADASASIMEDTPAVELRLALGGGVPGHTAYEDAVDTQSAEPLPDRGDGTDMLYSSGTTGRPKGVRVPHHQTPLDRPDPATLLCSGLFGFDDTSVYLSPAPMYHAAPLRFTLSVTRLGGTAVIIRHFDAEQALALIERHRVTHSQWVPTMFVRLLKLPPEARERYDLSSLRVAIHAAAPCPVPVKQEMIRWWGPVLHEYYAGTEGNGFVYTGSQDWLAHPGTVGKAILGSLHIVGDDGQEVPAGESGTIYFEGGGQFEYHNDAEKTAGSRTAAGWSTLGDVGYVDDDGFLFLTDRKAYMIITGGVNVYPQEAENALVTHPAVLDVAVFGVPNEDFGEEVKAVVQPASPEAAGPELERELIAYCRSQLADVKCPRSIDFRAELPRHPTGKLYKRLLKDEYWAGHSTTII